MKSSSSLGKWIPIHGKLYHFSQERIAFAKAKATCEHNFGKLFEPKTEAINNDIAVRARRYLDEEWGTEFHEIINPWIGIHHLYDEGRTVFASDNTTVVWSNWDAYEPNNVNDGEDCVHLYNERIEYICIYKYIGDGYCEDMINNEECDWDGGDCCGNNVVTDYCTVCECLEPNFDLLLPSYKFAQIGNGKCDDDVNTEEFKWDEGDCCGNHVNTAFCTVCECLEPSRWNDDNCDEFRRFICEKEGTG